jgi:hypothetical protein
MKVYQVPRGTQGELVCYTGGLLLRRTWQAVEDQTFADGEMRLDAVRCYNNERQGLPHHAPDAIVHVVKKGFCAFARKGKKRSDREWWLLVRQDRIEVLC